MKRLLSAAGPSSRLLGILVSVVVLFGAFSLVEPAMASWTNLANLLNQTSLLFILAAALQAGAQATDIIDGRRPCVLPNPGDPSDPFEITDAVSREPDTLAQMTWRSINCAYARLAQIVGLNRVVDTMYRMADSPYLNRNLDPGQRDPLQEYKSEAFALFNAMLVDLRERVTSLLLRIELRPEAPPPAPEGIGFLDMRHPDPAMAAAELEMANGGTTYEPVPMSIGTAAPRPVAEGVDPNDPSTWSRTPRNAPCPCGSGKKYKACHGRTV